MLKKLCISALAMIAVPALADSYWQYDGQTVVRLEANGNDRTFYIHKASANLRRQGVPSGVMLFDGQRNGYRYSGTAYAYPAACSYGVPYYVSGPVSKNQTKVVMTGRRPLDCNGSKTIPVTMTFTYLYSD
ncbi:hypothetical protein SAMN02745664_10616 [Moraxella cuniculi DSM 21768]|uniref:Uncharacterized protein n=2 Tax=Moraxella cuniculi TaxID=34061 RepID=A0A1N7EMC9_9GAMM|nr:hypothetical protein [Moraxella cuniculi]OOS07752.1 hypothetical protein B0189_02515 [Moraxella cuniculi]SIR89209.1 hypothetical protein SAMN02745664_10616 [Moraxella cuniculi DSM 21768]VEG13588.1 Uncharacterised protein [Moraxella cuniculi]